MALLAGLLIFFALEGLFLTATAWLPAGPYRILLEKAVFAGIAAMAYLAFRGAARMFPGEVRSRMALSPARSAAEGIATGLGLFGLLYILVRLFPGDPDPAVSWQFAAASMLAAVLEEILYRRLLMQYLLERSFPVMAIVMSAVCFAIAHPFPASGFLFFCGIAFGVLYWRSGLVSAILAHGVYNVAILLSART